MTDTDSLIRLAQGGDLPAYAALVERSQQAALGYARQLLGDFHLAEDAVQEAFLQAYLDLDKLNEPMAFGGWLRRIVHKHCDRVRRRKTGRLVGMDVTRIRSRSDPHVELEQAEESSRLKSGLLRLHDQERDILSLCYLRGLSHRQIASLLGLPESTVNIRLFRARQNLRKELTAMTTTDDIALLKPVHHRLALALQTLFGETMEMQVAIEVADPHESTYGQVIKDLGRHSCMYYFTAAPSDGWITIDFNVPLALALCNRCHSAEELAQETELRRSNPPDGGWLLNYQLGILGALIKRVLDQFVEAWAPATRLEWRDAQIEITPQIMLEWDRSDSPKPDESAVSIGFTVNAGDYDELSMKLCYPTSTVATLTGN
ncbi:MAG: sigma-70 family RNA polymerase sigma factor [Candidatus Latescibacteria bacterium]|nr:sigma-70 family RNA polymerase sigma factor [Candidatus Latescibacterota bacterium]